MPMLQSMHSEASADVAKLVKLSSEDCRPIMHIHPDSKAIFLFLQRSGPAGPANAFRLIFGIALIVWSRRPKVTMIIASRSQGRLRNKIKPQSLV